MPRNPNNKRVEVILSPAQYAYLTQALERQPVADLAELIRRALLAQFPEMPDDLPARGKYKR